MTLVLDCGALIALEHGDRAMWRRLKSAWIAAEIPVTHAGILGQAWRGKGSRQALLSRAIDGIDVRALDHVLGRQAGALLGLADRDDVIDAALVLLAQDGDMVVTSDPSDIAALAHAARRQVDIVRV